MNPIKWSPSLNPLDKLRTNPMPRQMYSMPRNNVVKPNMAPLYNALQQNANNQFTLQRDQQAFDRQIARDNANHMRQRALADQAYERRVKLQKEAEEKLKAQKDLDWERGGKLRYLTAEINLWNLVSRGLQNANNLEAANASKQNLNTVIESRKAYLDKIKGDAAQMWLSENVDDGWDAMSPSEKFGEQDFDWEHVVDTGDITVGGNTFTEDMGNDELSKKFYNLSGPEQLEFAKQVARRKKLNFDEEMMVTDEQKKMEEEIATYMTTASQIADTPPEDIAFIKQSIANVIKQINPNLEDVVQNELIVPTQNTPKGSPVINEGMGGDAAQQRSLDVSSEEPDTSINDITAIANSSESTRVKAVEPSQPDVKTNPINAPRRSMDDSTALSRGLSSVVQKAKTFDPIDFFFKDEKVDNMLQKRIALIKEAKKYGIPFTTYGETLREVEAAKAQ